MAEIVLAPLLQVIFEKLSNSFFELLGDFWEFEDRCNQLRQALIMIQAVLEDADGEQTYDKAARIWLLNLKHAAYEAGNSLDELTYIGSTSASSNIIKTRSILENLQKVALEGLNLNLRGRSLMNRGSEKRETSSFVSGSEVYGREEDKSRIIEKLLSSSSSTGTAVGGHVPVIPIFGIPGIGKTTVTQLVYNDDEVKKQFDLRIWVFVSDEFSVKKIVKAAIESATGEKCELSELDPLQSKLWKILYERRYLLVLDDVWSGDEDEWDRLRPVFRTGLDGSMIIVTTRSQKVALRVDTQNLAYQLKGLPESICWDLFKTRALLHEEGKNQNLMVIGKEIVRKCGGIPLAVKTLGSLMQWKREEGQWLDIQNSDIWNWEEYQTGILPALLLSYQHLPPHLKHCVAFCSTFPRNYVINKEKIIHMWIAHGLVLPDGGNKLLEEIGGEYFSELFWLSFFEDVKECENGHASEYIINELFYRLARFVMKKEILQNGLTRGEWRNIRHASCVSTNGQAVIPEALFEATHLQTLLVFTEGGIEQFPSDFFEIFIYLRVLDLSHCRQELPESIGKVCFLRYLDLSNSLFQNLPGAISSLCSLRTLNLLGCYNLKHLPELCQSLIHLNISGCEALTAMPSSFLSMVHLQTLPIFIVPQKGRIERMLHDAGRTFGDRQKSKGIEALKCLDLHPKSKSIAALKCLDLRGELKIKCLERVGSDTEAMEADLMNKKHIQSLGLCWGNDGADFIMNPALESSLVRFQERKYQNSGPAQESESGGVPSDPNLATEVLHCLQPHSNVENLFVLGYPGIKFPCWVLPKLTKVVLRKCRGCFQLPTLGQLPSLRSLIMEEIDGVEYIGQEFYGEDATVPFPSLQELFMQDFPLLKEWSSLDHKELFPKLSKLTLRKCPNLVLIPTLVSIHHLQLQECNPSILRCMEKLMSLSSLIIEGFDDLSCLPGELFRSNHLLEHLKISSCPKLHSIAPELEGLVSLKSLIIRWCGELLSLPNGFQNLTSLQSLEISDCHSLVALPVNAFGGLRSLRTLSLENCSHLASLSLGLQYLTALEDLTIMYCQSLASLPDTMNHLSALRSLTVLSCPQIEFLPEGFKDVTTLQSLEIRCCPKFSALPEWLDRFASLRSLAVSDCSNLKSLPTAVRHLSLLQHLSIQDCPDLQGRCQPDRGADWWKIAHVPYRHIFSSQFQHSSGVASSSN